MLKGFTTTNGTNVTRQVCGFLNQAVKCKPFLWNWAYHPKETTAFEVSVMSWHLVSMS